MSYFKVAFGVGGLLEDGARRAPSYLDNSWKFVFKQNARSAKIYC